MHRPDPYQDPPAYRWRQCGLATSRDIVTKAVVPEAWEYVVTVRPVVEDDASKPWTLSADLYAVDVALRHEAEGSFADTMSMRDLLDFLESDQGVSLTVREALALLRVGTRAANHPGALDRAEAWAPSRVAVERAAGGHPENIQTALTVEVRALADDSLLTFTMPSQRLGAFAAPSRALPSGCTTETTSTRSSPPPPRRSWRARRASESSARRVSSCPRRRLWDPGTSGISARTTPRASPRSRRTPARRRLSAGNSRAPRRPREWSSPRANTTGTSTGRRDENAYSTVFLTSRAPLELSRVWTIRLSTEGSL